MWSCWTFVKPSTRFHIAFYYISYIIRVSEDQFSNGFPHFLEAILKEWYTMVLSQMQWMSSVVYHMQGTVLGPLLFLIYINDLPDCISSSCTLFADDCLLYRTVHSKADREALHQDLENIQEGANKWLMTFNINKCEELQISLQRTIIKNSYLRYDQNL